MFDSYLKLPESNFIFQGEACLLLQVGHFHGKEPLPDPGIQLAQPVVFGDVTPSIFDEYNRNPTKLCKPQLNEVFRITNFHPPKLGACLMLDLCDPGGKC